MNATVTPPKANAGRLELSTAERAGVDQALSANFLPHRDLRNKSFWQLNLGLSGCSWLIGRSSGSSGPNPGQIRDNFCIAPRGGSRQNRRREKNAAGGTGAGDGGAGNEPAPDDDSAGTDAKADSALTTSRPPRRRPRQRDGARGLPSEEDRGKLAKAYLVIQHRLWPSLAKTITLPSPEDADALKAMADDLARRHMAAEVSENDSLDSVIRSTRLAAAYLRYSCDNSNPRSLDDQLVNVLNKAAQEQLFIPWHMVYADASITGLDASRRGYGSLKTALHNNRYASAVDAVIIDEFSRASRDTFEWFRLSFLCKRLRKNVLGASDGFVLNSTMGEMMLMVFGMFSRFFISQLREKVLRGMKGAARRKTSVGRPRLGYGLVPVLDAQGRPVVGAGGRVIRQKAIHPGTMEHVV